MDSEKTKECRRCGKARPLSEFGKDVRHGYLNSICRSCDAEAHRLSRKNETPEARELRLSKRRAIQKVRLGTGQIIQSPEVSVVVKRELCKDRSGLCFRCDEPCVDGKGQCVKHLEYERRRQVRLRKQRKQREVCWSCGKRPRAVGKLSCNHCQQVNKLWRTKFRQQCLDHYGRSCYCCGESNEGFLTFDHLENNGAAHRKSSTSARRICEYLVRNNYPTGYGVACFNCNSGRAVNGGICPHKERVNGRIEAETPD